MTRGLQRGLSIRTLAAIAGAAAAVLIVSTAPASIIPAIAKSAATGVVVTRATGSFWRGELHGVYSDGVKLGTISYRTDALSLLTGRIATKITVKDGALDGEGNVAADLGGRVTVKRGKFIFALEEARRYAMFGTPLSGTIRADIQNLSLSKRGCLAGKATVSTDILVAPARRFGGRAFDLAGDGVCKDGNFVLALTGQGDDGSVAMNLTISPALTYVVSAEAQPARTEVAQALQLFGFENANGVLTIGATGAIRSVGS